MGPRPDSPTLLGHVSTLLHLGAFQVLFLLSSRDTALDLHPLAWEDKVYFRVFQQPKRTDAPDRMCRCKDLRSLCYTLATTICLFTNPDVTSRAGMPFIPEQWVHLSIRLLLLCVPGQADGSSPATQIIPRWEVCRPGLR